MNTVTISKKEYTDLIKRFGKKVIKKAKVFDFDIRANFIGMWKKRKDMANSIAYIASLRKKEESRAM